MTDTFKTITTASPEILFKDRKSKFYGYAFPLNNEDEVKPIVEILQKQHPTAGHFCYAWKLGHEHSRYRANDDGEPRNSAGKPIYGQIQSFEVTNVLIVVVRIFGGTKLGVSGLINAYKTTAEMALKASNIEERIVEEFLRLEFDYTLMNDVMRILKKLNARITNQKMESNCKITLAVPQSELNMTQETLARLHQLRIRNI